MHSKLTFIPNGRGNIVGIQVSEPIEVYLWDGRSESYHHILVPGRDGKTRTRNFVDWNAVRKACNYLEAELKLRKPKVIKP